MGYANFTTGYRGIIAKREYRTLIACEIVPAVLVDGVPTSWKRVLTIGKVTETVKEYVGLSSTNANATGTSSGATDLTSSLTLSGGSNPVETSSREIERIKDGDSDLWIVRVTERSMEIVTSS